MPQHIDTTVTPDTVQRLLAAGAALGNPNHPAGDREPYRIVPEGFKAEPIPHATLAPLPDHIRQTVRLDDSAGFARYVNDHKDENTVIFAKAGDNGAATFTAIFDYHRKATTPASPLDSRPRHCAHRAVYACPFSIEWRAWFGVHGKPLAQEPFIDFLDANAGDIVEPSSADIRELALNFSCKTEVKFASSISRTVRGTQLTYQEDPQVGGGRTGTIAVPDLVKLHLPVFEGGEAHDVDARVVWDPRGGALKITVQLQRVERLLRIALEELREEIAGTTKIIPLTGGI